MTPAKRPEVEAGDERPEVVAVDGRRWLDAGAEGPDGDTDDERPDVDAGAWRPTLTPATRRAACRGRQPAREAAFGPGPLQGGGRTASARPQAASR